MRLERVAVIGAGAWGTALAQAAAVAGRDVLVVGRDAVVVDEINAHHANSEYLGPVALSPRIGASLNFNATTDFVVFAVPAQHTRAAIESIGGKALAGKPVILAAKGLEQKTLKRQSEILAELAPEAMPLALSGPSFAEDVAAGRPTAVTLAGDDLALADAVAAALAGTGFRPYAAGDLAGVELCGGLKNVYAIGCGAVEGAGLGASARAGLIARAYAELSRLVVALGGQAATLHGLAGLGDLTLSCTSNQSRNYRAGVALGSGVITAAPQVESMVLVEGVFTAPAAQQLAHRLGIEVPLIDAVNLLLSGEMHINDIVAGLMARPLKRED